MNASLTVSIMDSYQGSQQRLTLPAADGSAPRQITVTIPKGIQAGQHLRLAGQGMPGPNGGAAGDLLIAIAFSAHPYYHAEGKHVHLALPVAPWEAALGAKVSVPTPTGTITLTIPKHAAQGKKLRLKGKGLPAAEPGDLFVTLNIVLPEAHDETVVAAYDAFQQATDFDPRHHLFKEAL
ncbi:DnaJ C-terminal domain-containing protein [Vibrio parahaemolyticus]